MCHCFQETKGSVGPDCAIVECAPAIRAVLGVFQPPRMLVILRSTVLEVGGVFCPAESAESMIEP